MGAEAEGGNGKGKGKGKKEKLNAACLDAAWRRNHCDKGCFGCL